MPFMLPASMCATICVMLPIEYSIRSPITSVIAGAPPGYWIARTSVPRA
jgi:hypothetical protein